MTPFAAAILADPTAGADLLDLLKTAAVLSPDQRALLLRRADELLNERAS